MAAVCALLAGRSAMDAVDDVQKIINGTDIAKDSGIKLSLSLCSSKSQLSSSRKKLLLGSYQHPLEAGLEHFHNWYRKKVEQKLPVGD